MTKTTIKVISGIFLVLILAAASVLVSGVYDKTSATQINQINTQVAPSLITEDKARLTGLSAIDQSQVGNVTDIELEVENGIQVYSIEFTKGTFETDVKINAVTGTIIAIEDDSTDIDEKEEFNDDKDDKQVAQDDSALLDHETAVDDLNDEETPLTTQEQAQTREITQEEAKSIALSVAAGNVTDVELEKVNGVIVYTVEVTDGNKETDVFVDVKTGVIVKIEID